MVAAGWSEACLTLRGDGAERGGQGFVTKRPKLAGVMVRTDVREHALSCSSPRPQCVSMTALRSQCPSPSGRTWSAGAASAGLGSASSSHRACIFRPRLTSAFS